MYIRDEVRERWTSEGLFERKNPKLEAFLKYIDDHPLQCWDEYLALFREQYYDLFDVVVPPLLKSRDKLLRHVIVAKADVKKPKELAAVKQIVRQADPVADKAMLLAVARKGEKTLLDEMKKRKKLTVAIQNELSPPPVATRPVTNVRITPPGPAPRVPKTKPRAAKTGKPKAP